jgi:hypothetical protein
MPKTKTEAELLDILRSLLRETFRLQSEGATQPRLSQALGYVDGYVRALIETGAADHRALLAIVREVRSEARGPATGHVGERATIAA